MKFISVCLSILAAIYAVYRLLRRSCRGGFLFEAPDHEDQSLLSETPIQSKVIQIPITNGHARSAEREARWYAEGL